MSFESSGEEPDGHPETFDTMFGTSISDFLKSAQSQCVDETKDKPNADEAGRAKLVNKFVTLILSPQNITRLETLSPRDLAESALPSLLNSFKLSFRLNDHDEIGYIKKLSLQDIAIYVEEQSKKAQTQCGREIPETDGYKKARETSDYWVKLEEWIKAAAEEEKRRNS